MLAAVLVSSARHFSPHRAWYVQIALTTLEEVFLNIAKEAEIEAAGDGATVEVFVEEGVPLMVPLGSDTIQNPVSGESYRLFWTQDDQGALIFDRAERLASAAAPVPGTATAAATTDAPATAPQPAADRALVQISVEESMPLMVPSGSDTVRHPVTGVTYHLFWTQDEQGAPVFDRAAPAP